MKLALKEILLEVFLELISLQIINLSKPLETFFCIYVDHPTINRSIPAAGLNEKYSYLFFTEINPPPSKIYIALV